MIVLFSDFGWYGPYVGQMKTVLACEAPTAHVVDLMHDAPAYAPQPAAYLLASLIAHVPPAAVLLCVVDPGVGDPTRRPVVVQADGRWFVGPDNGLFNVVARRAARIAWWDITWRPALLCDSFHGRDLFAPVAARLARGEAPPGRATAPDTRVSQDWPEDLAEIIYVDGYGNAMTGQRACHVAQTLRITVSGHTLQYKRTFSAALPGEAFWYENALGLVEIAVNQGHAAQQLGLAPGMPLRFSGP